MINRKEIKKEAKKSLKKHYLLFILVCLMAAFVGSEFRGSLIFTDGIESSVNSNISNLFYEITGKEPIITDAVITDRLNERLEPALENEITQSITERIEPLNENIKNMQDKAINDAKSLSGTKGVFASIINSISSTNILVTLTKGILSVVDSKNVAYMIVIIITIVIWLAFNLFIIELYKVISRRIFLEGRTYKKVPIERFLYIFKMKKTIKASFTIFLTNFKCSLWSLTIIMLPIKYYEYIMVPYIVSENPKISSKEAIKLSRQMMHGNKWKTFVFDLSFIGYSFLGYISLGLFNIFFTNPYKMCSYCELYSRLRKEAIENKYIGYKYLNDRYLFEKANEEKILSSYGDIKEFEESIKKPNFELNKFKLIILKYFGINILSETDTEIYEKYMVDTFKISQYKDEMSLLTYPTRLSNNEVKTKKKSKRIENVNYLKPYTISSLIIMFFIMCLIGYVWEVTLNIIVAR